MAGLILLAVALAVSAAAEGEWWAVAVWVWAVGFFGWMLRERLTNPQRFDRRR